MTDTPETAAQYPRPIAEVIAGLRADIQRLEAEKDGLVRAFEVLNDLKDEQAAKDRATISRLREALENAVDALCAYQNLMWTTAPEIVDEDRGASTSGTCVDMDADGAIKLARQALIPNPDTGTTTETENG